LRSDRTPIEFRSLPPAARDDLKAVLGDRITVQESDWNRGSLVTPNHKRKPFDDARVRRALTLAIDRWHGVPALLKVNRNVDQPYKYVGTWMVDEWSKIGLKVTQRMMPTGPWLEAMRRGEFDVVSQANCRGVPNPLLDVQPYLPASVFTANYGRNEDPAEVALYDKMLRETDFTKQRALMREFEKLVIDTEAHELWIVWWYRTVPYRSYVKGWTIGPSHLNNQALTTV
jgi:ABC-type transport system substrate-binding protein